MMDEISTALKQKCQDKNLHCISSTGPTWSSGLSFKELIPESGVEQKTVIFEKLIELIFSIRKSPVPVIAKVNGVVAAGGVQLVASCDIIVCSNKSSFITPSANYGVFASIPAITMSRLMPHHICLDMLLTGNSLSAEEAHTHGMKSRSVLALGKEFFYKHLELSFGEAHKQGAKSFAIARNLCTQTALVANSSRTMTTQYLQRYCQITEENGVREICLNEPKTRNTLSLQMMDEISVGLTKNWQDQKLRCIVISSTGPIWSSGHNLRELAPERGVEQQTAVFEKLTEIIFNIRKAPVPVIAKVNGVVAAGGVQLVASCDIIVCSDKSSFITPSANYGVFASTPAVAMSRVMSHSKCLDMLMTGHPISAKEAHIQGMVSRVVPENELDNEMLRITNAIKQKSRSVLALGKEFFYKQMELSLQDAYKQGAKKMTENLKLEDSVEGVRSFMEKRKPVWSHL